jgi:hypothetical protein
MTGPHHREITTDQRRDLRRGEWFRECNDARVDGRSRTAAPWIKPQIRRLLPQLFKEPQGVIGQVRGQRMLGCADVGNLHAFVTLLARSLQHPFPALVLVATPGLTREATAIHLLIYDGNTPLVGM